MEKKRAVYGRKIIGEVRSPEDEFWAEIHKLRVQIASVSSDVDALKEGLEAVKERLAAVENDDEY